MSTSRGTMRRAWSQGFQLTVCVLALLVAVGASLPWLARSISGPRAHVCHCETGSSHAHCACPICFPELDDGGDHLASEVKGSCGDDDAGWRTFSHPAVFAPHAIVLPRDYERLAEGSFDELSSHTPDPPEPPPPRSSLDV